MTMFFFFFNVSTDFPLTIEKSVIPAKSEHDKVKAIDHPTVRPDNQHTLEIHIFCWPEAPQRIDFIELDSY